MSQDYWRCPKCDELNPPLPRNCLRCWTLRQDWLPEELKKSASSSPKPLPPKPSDQSATLGGSALPLPFLLLLFLFFLLPSSPSSSSISTGCSWSEPLSLSAPAAGSDGEEHDGVDVPDCKQPQTPPLSQCLEDSAPLCGADSSAPDSASQELLLSSSQPSCSESQPSSSCLSDSQELLPSEAPPPELERSVSAEWRLPESCLDPCLICQSRPKNGCIVHGRTGHMISCYLCARKLKKRNKLCPVCRMPIQSVILTYLS